MFEKLSITSKAMEEFREQLDAAINRAIRAMTAKKIQEAQVTFKLTFEINPDELEAEGVTTPMMEGKASIVLPARYDLKKRSVMGPMIRMEGNELLVGENQITIEEVMQADE